MTSLRDQLTQAKEFMYAQALTLQSTEASAEAIRHAEVLLMTIDELEDLDDLCNRLKDENYDLQAEVADLRSEITEVRDELALAKEEIQAMVEEQAGEDI